MSVNIKRLLALVATAQTLHAGSATWNLNPTSGNWNTASNWTPATVPNGPSDMATFDTSSNTAISVSANTEVNGITYSSGAGAFTTSFISRLNPTLTLSGVGITNNSTNTQSFVVGEAGSGSYCVMQFRNAATAGEGTAYTLSEQANQMDFFDTSSAGSGAFTAFAYSLMYFHDSATAENVTFNFIGGDYLATLVFYNSSTAANGTFTLSGAGAGYGSEVAFVDSSTAGHALFNIGYDSLLVLNDTATADHGAFANAGEIVLYGETLGNAVITNSGSSDPAFGSASLNIYFESTAGDAVITNDGATTSGVFGAATNFVGFLDFSIATAGNASIIASPGSNGGGGGFIYFTLATDGGTSRIELFGNGTGDFSSGTLDISEHNPPGVTIGSLEGSGLVTLGANELTIGSNNLSTLFSGVIEEGQNGTGGSLVKSGMGRLTLSNASTYTGGTTVSEGTLLVTNRTGSATGTSSVTVNGGAFGGTGKVSGALTIGTATTAAILAPGSGKKPGKLTTTQTLTFNVRGTYRVDLNSTRSEADQVIAKGVTITSGARITVTDSGTATLASGTAFILINNTANSPIIGAFSNLADGSTLTVGSNTYLVSYEGGTGNDLTLTVVS